MNIRVLALAVFCGAFAAVTFGKTIYVSPEGGGDGSSPDSPTTYQAGIAAARSSDTVQLADGEYKANVKSETGDQDPFNLYGTSAYSDVTVVGNVEHPEKVILDAHGAGVRFLGIKAAVIVRGITFRNQFASSDSYPAIWGGSGTALNIDHCVFSGITNKGNCAAINIKTSGGAVIEDCQFVDCASTGGSGVVGADTDAVKATLRRCTFTRCSAMNGGALWKIPEVVEGCIFEDCHCGESTGGGAVYLCASGAAFTNCVFHNCYSGNTKPGGALYLKSDAEFVDCEFKNCTTSGNNPKGGAVYTEKSLTMKGGVIDNCGANNPSGTPYGSAVYVSVGATFENVELKNCRTAGGAICVYSATFSGCQFHDCSVADSSSGCIIRARSTSSSVTIENCSFVSLTASRGAALNTVDKLAKLIIRNCLFAGCVSTTGNGGAAIEAGAETFNVDNCTFADCRITGSSNDYADPLEISDKGGTLTANNCIFWDNWRMVGTPQLRSVYVRAGSGTLSHSAYDGMRSDKIPAISECQIITACPFVQDGSWDDDVFTPGDYTLAEKVGGEANPCLGAGVKLDWMTADSKDLAGNPRVRENDLVDLGCYAYLNGAANHGLLIFVR